MSEKPVIQASDFNSIKTKAELVLGTGVGSLGYGQSVTATTANSKSVLYASQWDALRNDMIKVRQHQTGQVVGSLSTDDGQNLYPVAAEEEILEQTKIQYSNFADTITDNKFLVDPAQLTTTMIVDSSRTTSWNNTITQTIVITGTSNLYNSADNLRYFFNAGGNLTFQATLATNTKPKNTSWHQLLNNIGTIKFNHSTTTYTGSQGVGSSIGYHQLTTQDQIIFEATASGLYSANYYRLYARLSADKSQLICSVQLADLATESPIDNNVSGTLISRVWQATPSGSNIEVSPLIATHSGLNTTGFSSSLYTITPDKTIAGEDETVTFNVVSNVEDNTVLYWTTTGTVNAADFVDNLVSGQITIVNNLATISRPILYDITTEGTDSFSIQLRTGSISGPVVATSSIITITDTSMNPSFVMTANTLVLNEQHNNLTPDTVVFTITKANYDRPVYYQINHISTQSSDFISPLTGTVAFTGNNGSLSIRISTDNINENDEHFEVLLKTDAGITLATSPRIRIAAFYNPIYSIVATNIVNNENTTATFRVNTQHVSNGTVLYWTISHGSTSPADFSPNSGALSINNNSASGSFSVIYEGVNEAAETFTLQLRTGSTSGPVVASTGVLSVAQQGTQQISGGNSTAFYIPQNSRFMYVFALGGAGGGGGDDSQPGAFGSPGYLIQQTVNVKPGDYIQIFSGSGGERGYTGSNARGGNPGPNGWAQAGRGGNSGWKGGSGSGGAGGSGSFVFVNGNLIIAAGGGAGGGGGGHFTPGYNEDQSNIGFTGVPQGGAGQDKSTQDRDGGGAGGGGSGFPSGGAGGYTFGSDGGGLAGRSGQSFGGTAARYGSWTPNNVTGASGTITVHWW
jgi:hypothetical protein